MEMKKDPSTLPAVKGEETDALYVRPEGELRPSFFPPFFQLPFGLVMDLYMIISKEKTFLERQTGYWSYAFLFVIVFNKAWDLISFQDYINWCRKQDNANISYDHPSFLLKLSFCC